MNIKVILKYHHCPRIDFTKVGNYGFYMYSTCWLAVTLGEYVSLILTFKDNADLSNLHTIDNLDPNQLYQGQAVVSPYSCR